MPSIESYQLLLAAAAACEDKKAEDIRILALNPEESGLSDYFLICNGTSDRQNGAISDEIEIRLKRDFETYPNAVEGRRQGEWILMDYVDFIVHIFSPEKRAFYGLERLRKSAVTVSTDQLTTELTDAMEAQLAPKRKAGTKTTPAKVAPVASQTPPPAKKRTRAQKSTEEEESARSTRERTAAPRAKRASTQTQTKRPSIKPATLN